MRFEEMYPALLPHVFDESVGAIRNYRQAMGHPEKIHLAVYGLSGGVGFVSLLDIRLTARKVFSKSLARNLSARRKGGGCHSTIFRAVPDSAGKSRVNGKRSASDIDSQWSWYFVGPADSSMGKGRN